MGNDRRCIVCMTVKPISDFGKCGEHIVPQSIGNRNWVSHNVCQDCNSGLGRKVDLALKRVFKVAKASFVRGVSGINGDPMKDRKEIPECKVNMDDTMLFGYLDGVPVYRINENNPLARKYGPNAILNGYINEEGNQCYYWTTSSDYMPQDEPDVKGALLKIAYEATHIELGDAWLYDPRAVAIRQVLSAYVNKDINKAHMFMNNVAMGSFIQSDFLYSMIDFQKQKNLDYAICHKSCLNGALLVSLYHSTDSKKLLFVVDIEGLPLEYVIVSDSDWGIGKYKQLYPKFE